MNEERGAWGWGNKGGKRRDVDGERRGIKRRVNERRRRGEVTRGEEKNGGTGEKKCRKEERRTT